MTHVRRQRRPGRRTSRNFLRPPYAARAPSRAALAAAAAVAASWCCRCRCSQAVWREAWALWSGFGPGLGPWSDPVPRRCCSAAAAAAALAASPCRCSCSHAARLRSCACGKVLGLDSGLGLKQKCPSYLHAEEALQGCTATIKIGTLQFKINSGNMEAPHLYSLH